MSTTVDNARAAEATRRSSGRRGRRTSLLASALVAAAALALLPATLSPASAQQPVASAASATPAGSRSAATVTKRYYCHGRRATIVGTQHADILRGTRHADVIVGLGGNDIILGGKGRDLICGGRGADMINAMQGRRQRVYGGRGTDYCFAPNAREHRYHFQCEAHLPSGASAKGLAAQARGALSAATKGRTPLTRLPSVARRSQDPTTVGADKIMCESYDVGAPTNANIPDAHGDIYATAAWTVPSRVGIVPVYWTWTNSGWSAMVTDQAEARVSSIDAYDGTATRFPLRMTLPATNAVFFVGYYFLWQNPNTGAWDRGGLNVATYYADTMYSYGEGNANLGFCYTALQR